MVRQRILVLIAIFIIVTDAGPVRRRRRETADAKNSVFAVPCPVQCAWSFAQAWSKAISFETPTENMVDNPKIFANNGTFDIMCSLYLSHRVCLRGCLSANNNNVEFGKALSASPSHTQLCSDHKEDFDSYSPCISNNTKIFQRVCQKENENLLAASVRLTTQPKVDPAIARQFCSAANQQSFCVLPVLRQTCGDAPYNSMRSIVNATFASVRATIGDDAIEAFYPECAVFFVTIENGIDTQSASNKTVSDQSLPINGTTVDFGNSTDIYNVTPSIRRDDPNGPIYPGTGKEFRQTTESSGSTGTVIHQVHILMISTFFVISYNLFHS